MVKTSFGARTTLLITLICSPPKKTNDVSVCPFKGFLGFSKDVVVAKITELGTIDL